MDIKPYERYFALDESVPYKDILIYPAKVKDYYIFNDSITCLTIEKDKLPVIDPQLTIQILKMSYLEFLLFVMENGEESSLMTNMFNRIVRLCLRPDNFTLFRANSGEIVIYIKHQEKETFITDKEFDEIRKIILFQNIPNYDDRYYDPKVEESLRETQEYLANKQDKVCGFEDQLVATKLVTGSSYDEIHNWTLRKFSKTLDRYEMKLTYQICKTGEMSGMVEFKTPIKHWLREVEDKGKYGDLLIGYDETKSKLQQGNNFSINK